VLPEQLPPTPILDRLLTRGDQISTPAGTLETLLLERFGLPAETGTAPYALKADDPRWDEQGWWLHAEPVHLRADLDRLRLYDSRHLGIEPAEARALADAFNAHFAGDGLRLCAPSPQRWYLQAENPPRITTHPLSEVAGRSIEPFLPTGDDARRWAGLMNEAQMLFHQHPVNQAREAAGRPAINGLWTWGGGRWAAIERPADLAAIYADLPLATGLATAAEVPILAPTADALRLQLQGDHLLIQHACQSAVLDADAPAWCEAVAALDAELAPALDALRNGRLAALVVDTGDGSRHRFRRSALPRFRRRGKPLAARVATTATGPS
jgi:hypothetical protein